MMCPWPNVWIRHCMFVCFLQQLNVCLSVCVCLSMSVCFCRPIQGDRAQWPLILAVSSSSIGTRFFHPECTPSADRSSREDDGYMEPPCTAGHTNRKRLP